MNQTPNPRLPISPGCSKAFIFVVGRLFPLSFGFGSMIFLGVGLWMINKGMQSENWDKGTATITSSEIEKMHNGSNALSLVIDLDGACVSCGAAPGTLKGIQDDLLMDDEVVAVRFSSQMLEWFDELQREFVLLHGGVSFVEV